MAWDERQRRMLEAMGIRLWAPAVREAREEVEDREEVEEGEAVEAASAEAAAETLRRQARVGSVGSPGPASKVAAAPPRAEAAPPAALDALDWPALRAAVAACTGCGLCATRTNTVFGVGAAGAQWMVVGEAPGEQEDRAGEPFVGKAGQLLDRMLRAIDVERADDDGEPGRRAFICNVLKCRPPGNRNPTPDEVRRCEPFLRRQVALLQPRIVLALGRFAVQALLGSDEPIGRLRGRVHRYEGRPLVVSYHPAYLLRNPADKARAWDDLCLARETLAAAVADAPP
ncbi:MAG TPA: uracil-DNA glycosylase [Methylibium sp.]|uniref:uracil-DNA glycosylase n=1 Tax=Methylibium sp. TaxID=2067992 RepID=UPI002DB86F60|nr:uracil-DNA glycosylase [Methylibium sp.]HEU4458741.1 uracil-DNA glycosylase [Methylibium sp.]